MRRLLKFKCDKEAVDILVKYDTEVKGAGWDIVTLEGCEKPSLALVTQLRAMVGHLIAIAELPADWLDDLTVIGVTRTIGENGTGLVLTGLRELAHQDAPLCINSPHTTSFSMQCTLDLAELERLVLRYVDGQERAQRQLHFAAAPAVAMI
jgi:hypothetical protein